MEHGPARVGWPLPVILPVCGGIALRQDHAPKVLVGGILLLVVGQHARESDNLWFRNPAY